MTSWPAVCNSGWGDTGPNSPSARCLVSHFGFQFRPGVVMDHVTVKPPYNVPLHNVGLSITLDWGMSLQILHLGTCQTPWLQGCGYRRFYRRWEFVVAISIDFTGKKLLPISVLLAFIAKVDIKLKYRIKIESNWNVYAPFESKMESKTIQSGRCACTVHVIGGGRVKSGSKFPWAPSTHNFSSMGAPKGVNLVLEDWLFNSLSLETTDKRKDPQMEIVAVFKRIPKNQLMRHTTLFSLRSVPWGGVALHDPPV